jgi:hypothetical protein
MRDLFLRLGFESYFAYREWDFVPDVMIYTNRFPVGFPNGRLLTDDVAAILAQHGDTLLYELSHHNGQWPRTTKNDKAFRDEFPYLAAPWGGQEPPEQHQLSTKNKLIVFTLTLVFAVVVVLALFQVVHIVRRWIGVKPPESYL